MIIVQQAASRLGLSVRTVQKWCRVLGYERVGRDYILTEKQIDEIAARAHDKPGRPPTVTSPLDRRC